MPLEVAAAVAFVADDEACPVVNVKALAADATIRAVATLLMLALETVVLALEEAAEEDAAAPADPDALPLVPPTTLPVPLDGIAPEGAAPPDVPFGGEPMVPFGGEPLMVPFEPPGPPEEPPMELDCATPPFSVRMAAGEAV